MGVGWSGERGLWVEQESVSFSVLDQSIDFLLIIYISDFG